MWLLNANRLINLNFKNSKNTNIFYNNLFYLFLKPIALKKKKSFFYTTGVLKNNWYWKLCFEQQIVRFKYLGKSYRISKKNKMLHLNLHFPTFKYVIWKNMILFHSKKKKKLFKFLFLSTKSVGTDFFQNFWRLRIPNTYTRRGVYNNMRAYYNRKTKIVSRR